MILKETTEIKAGVKKVDGNLEEVKLQIAKNQEKQERLRIIAEAKKLIQSGYYR